MPQHPRHYALVIGIDHYPKFRSLSGACKDARDFYSWLLDTSAGGGVPEENVELVLSAPDPVRPIHEEIDDALERILLEARRISSAERLYLYFSGHGLARSNFGADLCLAKWSKRRRAMALDSMNYLNLVMGCGYFREVVFLMDCCRVREVRSTALPSTIELPGPGDDAPASRSFVGYATEFMNAAYEADAGGNGTTDEVRGHFTVALMQALKGAAADAPGGVKASRLKEYLEIHTPLIAASHNHVQKPEVINGLPARREPVFGSALPSEQPTGFAIIIAFQSGREGEIVVEDGQLHELKRGDATTGPWRVPVSGRTVLLIRHMATGQEQTVRVNGDEREDIHVSF